MDTHEDDVVYVLAVRARGPNRGQAIQDVLKVINLARADQDDEYFAVVLAKSLQEAYGMPNGSNGRMAPGNMCEALTRMGFDWKQANRVVPVAVESAA